MPVCILHQYEKISLMKMDQTTNTDITAITHEILRVAYALAIINGLGMKQTALYLMRSNFE